MDTKSFSKKCGWDITHTKYRWSRGLKVYEKAWNAGTVLIEPNDDGVFASLPYVELELPNPDEYLPLATEPPAPGAIIRPVKTGKYYYVIYVGEELGIFGDW